MSDDLSDQMAEALRRQREHGERAAWIDRRDWTQEQWADDAERLMHDIDGAITSLVNGHVNALIRERQDLRVEVAALRAALAAQPQPLDRRQFVQRLGDAIAEQLDLIDVRAIAEAAAGSATPTGDNDE